MKKILTILLIFLTIISHSQISPNAPLFQRSTPGNTVVDARLMAQYNFYTPRYTDTTAANVPSSLSTADSCGALIFTYDVNALWLRVCSPKHWERVQGIQALPDGVYMGGDVGWTGTGLDFFETAATYILNGVLITSPTVIPITLVPSDPTFGRIDLIGLGPTGPTVITGVPASSPQEPSYNPQTFIRRAAVLVEAGALTPTITTNIIYDEDLGLPDEWTPSNIGGTIDFANTLFPYHLTVAAHITALDSSNRILFNYSDTVNSAPRGSLVGFIRLSTPMALGQNLYVQLFNAGLPVSLQLPFTGSGMFRGITSQYQPLFFSLPSFGAANIIFDEIRIIPTGAGAFPVMDIDFLQFQTGFSPIVTQRDFAVVDNFAYSNRAFNQNGFPFTFTNGNFGIRMSTTPPHTLSLGNDINNQFAFSIYAPDGTSGQIDASTISLLQLTANNTIILRPKPAQGFMQYQVDGNGSPFQDWYGSGNTSLGRIGIDILEAGVSREFYIKPAKINEVNYLTLYDSIKLRGVQNATVPDSLVTITGGVVTRTATASIVSGSTNSNIGAGYRWAVPGTNNIKTAFVTNGILADSSSNSDGITFQIDSLNYATNGRLQKLIDSTTANYTNLFSTVTTLSNVGAAYRIIIPNTNTAKTLNSGYSLSWDSTTSNELRISIDTTLMATRAWAQSIAGGGGFTGVTSVAGTNANGFSLSIATPTSTPNITIGTTITGLLAGNGTAISAASGSDINTAFGSQTANFFYAAPNGAGGNPSFRAMVAADVPTLNQNTTGTAATITGISTVVHGGSGLASLTAYALLAGGITSTGNMQQVSGVGTSGQVLTSTGAGALPTWQTPTVTAGVSSITGTANQVIASAATGAVTLSLPQSIATTSTPTFRSLTLGGTAATTPLTFVTNTDATASAGRWYYNTTRLGFSLSSTILRVPLTNDVTPANGQIPIGNGTNYTVAAIAPTDNATLVNNGAGSISIGPNKTFQTLTDGATITWNAANGFNAQVTLGGTGRNLTRTNWVNGQTYTLIIIQDGTGNRTITTWPSGTLWPGGLAPVLPTAANSRTIVSFIFNGTNCYGAYTNAVYQ